MPVPLSFKILRSTSPHATGATKGEASKALYALHITPYMSRPDTVP